MNRNPEKVLIVAPRIWKSDKNYNYSIEELSLLIDTLGLKVCGVIEQKLNRINPAYFVGSGKAKQIVEQAKLLKADNVPNAFCLPNGRIAIYTGILPLTKNIDGLAAVMGHEVAHATQRHGGKRMTSSQLNGVAMAVIDASLDNAEVDNETRAHLMGAIGLVGQYAVTLPYSRGHETEADIWGIRYAIRAGFDPNEAPKLWERMAALGSSGPEWMSTHPDPLERAKKLRELIPRILQEETKRNSKSGN